MTVIAQDDHLTAGAWAACATSKMKLSNGVPCIIDRYITNEYQILFTYYFASVKINCPSDANY